MLWLLMGLFIFALFAGFVLTLDWLDPQGSRVFRSGRMSAARGEQPRQAANLGSGHFFTI